MAQRQVSLKEYRERHNSTSETDHLENELMGREKYRQRDGESSSSSDSDSDGDNDSDIKEMLRQAKEMKKQANQKKRLKEEKKLEAEKKRVEEEKKLEAEKKRVEEEKKLEAEKKRVEEEKKVEQENGKTEQKKYESETIDLNITNEAAKLEQNMSTISSECQTAYIKYLEQKTKLHREEAGLCIMNKKCQEKHLENLTLINKKLELELELILLDVRNRQSQYGIAHQAVKSTVQDMNRNRKRPSPSTSAKRTESPKDKRRR